MRGRLIRHEKVDERCRYRHQHSGFSEDDPERQGVDDESTAHECEVGTETAQCARVCVWEREREKERGVENVCARARGDKGEHTRS